MVAPIEAVHKISIHAAEKSRFQRPSGPEGESSNILGGMRRERLLDLYGPRLGEQAAVELDGLLARFRPKLAGRKPAGGGGASNVALLITYGDTLSGDPGTPLAALHEFAARHLEGRLSGIHLLPFFPYSSDYGFAVKDYLAVRPDLGTWADVDALNAVF